MRKQSQGTEEGARERLDMLLVARGLAGSRSRAKEMILAGEVYVDGRKVCKAGTFCEAEGADIRVLGQELRYVSRGGLKLERRCGSGRSVWRIRSAWTSALLREVLRTACCRTALPECMHWM